MEDNNHYEILKQGVHIWNRWRMDHPGVNPNLQGINLDGADLKGIDLNHADLSQASFYKTNLEHSLLMKTALHGANLENAILRNANLTGAKLVGATLHGAVFERAKLDNAILKYACMDRTSFVNASLTGAELRDVKGVDANFSEAKLTGANLQAAILIKTNFHNTNLTNINLRNADITNSTLKDANLRNASLVETIVAGVNFEGCRIYGISVWDLVGEPRNENDLIINPSGKHHVQVDNLEVAQFVYLILNNAKLRNVIDTITSKAVLILGRFAIPERKAILDALRSKLREYDLLPIVFDFDRPTDKDFTETIKTLAGLAYFVIADITNPKSSPLELQATIPDYQIPFVPIIQEGESPFAMMVDLQKKYNWVLNTVSYDSQETLIKVLKPLIVEPAMKKRQELRLIKAQEREVISGKDFLAKGDQ